MKPPPANGAEDEAQLLEKLRRIEALFAGTDSAGERLAAERARQVIVARLAAKEEQEPPVEFRFKLADTWSRQVFLALLRRYNLKPFRYARQRRTTVMVCAPRSFVNETLWPEFEELSAALHIHLETVTTRIVEEVLGDAGEAEERIVPARLPPRS